MTTKEINQNSRIKNPTLSLCMIVKDEEKSLPTCLESVKDHVDEIIIVDTGSTDKTVEIATNYNAKIYHHPWENSFSKARNYSLSYATCDWILILDADEEIEKKDACKLREVIKDNEINLINIPVFCKPKGGQNRSVSCSGRIFRNYQGFRYEGIVHNELIYSGIEKKVNIRLYHYGYHQGEEQMVKKFKRTSTLLKEQIKDNPENPVPHHYLAISYLDRKKNDECIKEALEAIRLFESQNSNSHFRLISYYTACVAYYRMNDLINAEKYALKTISFHPDYLDAYCILTSIYFLQKEYNKCVKATKNYLKLLEAIESDPSKALSTSYNTLNHAWLTHTRMAINHYEQGNHNYGQASLNSAINCADNAWKPYFEIGKHFIQHNNLILAEKFLRDGIKMEPNNKELYYYLADTYEKSGSTEKALKCYRNILDNYKDEITADYRTGLLHLKNYHFEKAIKSFKSVINKDAKNIFALFNLAISYERIENIAQAKNIYHKIIKINSECPEVYIRLGNLYLNESDYINAKEYFINAIKLDKYLLEAHLALSKIYIYQDDLESCVENCNQLLKFLNLPRDITINNLSDLSKLYIQIGKTLLKHQKENLSGFSFDIALLLDPEILNNDSLLQNVT